MPGTDLTPAVVPPRRGMLARYRAKHPGSPIASIAYHDAQALTATIACLILYRQRTFGIGNIPRRGPLLIVANHQSFLDPLIIGGPIGSRRHLDYIARIGLFANPAISAYLKTLNTIPIRQDEPDAAAIRETLRRISMGRAVLIFAEGSRTTDGTVQPFKRGVALLVRRARCPVVPLALEGAFDTWPRSRTLPRVFGCRLMARFGEPISHQEILEQDAGSMLVDLRERIESMRLDLRSRMREQTSGRFPPDPA